MNCRDCQDELLLMAGQDMLPDEITDHLAACPDCRERWRELETIKELISVQEDFLLDAIEQERVLTDVARRIGVSESGKADTVWRSVVLEPVTTVGWQTYLSMAAAILLLLGISMTGSWQERLSRTSTQAGGSPSDTGAMVSLLSLYDGGADQLDDVALNLIMSDYGQKGYFEASEQLLDDLSDEELQYLEKHFDLGEVL